MVTVPEIIIMWVCGLIWICNIHIVYIMIKDKSDSFDKELFVIGGTCGGLLLVLLNIGLIKERE